MAFLRRGEGGDVILIHGGFSLHGRWTAMYAKKMGTFFPAKYSQLSKKENPDKWIPSFSFPVFFFLSIRKRKVWYGDPFSRQNTEGKVPTLKGGSNSPILANLRDRIISFV